MLENKISLVKGDICHSWIDFSAACRSLFVGSVISKTRLIWMKQAIMFTDKKAKQQEGKTKFHGQTFV